MNKRITARLAILSETVLPNRITELLEFTPDKMVIKGVDRQPPRPTPQLHGWYVTEVSSDELSTPESVLASLLKRISGLSYKIAEIKNLNHDFIVKIHVAISSSSRDIPLFFDKQVVLDISSLGSSLDIEFFD